MKAENLWLPDYDDKYLCLKTNTKIKGRMFNNLIQCPNNNAMILTFVGHSI